MLAGFGSFNQLCGGQVEHRRQPAQARIHQIALAGLDIGDPLLLKAAAQRKLFLGQAKLVATRFDSSPQSYLNWWGEGHERVASRWQTSVSMSLQ
jgi:hypothetical protein